MSVFIIIPSEGKCHLNLIGTLLLYFFSICDTVKLYYLKHWPKMSYFFSRKKKKNLNLPDIISQCLLWVLGFELIIQKKGECVRFFSWEIWGMCGLTSTFNIAMQIYSKKIILNKCSNNTNYSEKAEHAGLSPLPTTKEAEEEESFGVQSQPGLLSKY